MQSARTFLRTKLATLLLLACGLAIAAPPTTLLAATKNSTSMVNNTAEAHYPAKPITIIVPWGVNSDGDIAARSLAKHIAQYLGAPEFIIENIPGASGSTATIRAQNAEADGYTLLLARVGSHVIAPAMDPSLAYSWNQFTFLGLLEINPQIFAVRSDAPYKTIRELTQAIRLKPGTLTFGTTGSGTIPSLSTQYLFKLSGLKPDAAEPVTLSGGGKVATDALLSGKIDFICTPISQSLIENAKNGNIRPLFTTVAGRIPEFPELQNAAEAGVRNMNNLSSWSLLTGPQKLPELVVSRWKEALKHLSTDKDWLHDVTKRGSISALGTIKDNQRFIKSQYDLYEQLIRSLNLQKPAPGKLNPASASIPK